MSAAARQSIGHESGVDFGAFVPGAHHIELVDGHYLDLAAPDPSLITPEVIAHGLAHVCRFAGQARRFYSVAEHAVLVAERLMELRQPPPVVFAGLHHDDSEAFIGDVTRPLKALLPGYADLERRLSAVIEGALGLPPLGAEARAVVKGADDWALSCEAHYLLPSQGTTWFCAGLFDPDAYAPRTMGRDPTDSRRRWFSWHRSLARQAAAYEAEHGPASPAAPDREAPELNQKEAPER